MTTGHVTTQDERTRDAALVARIERQMPERRRFPRCTHRPEDIMRMTDTDCPACSPANFCADDGQADGSAS